MVIMACLAKNGRFSGGAFLNNNAFAIFSLVLIITISASTNVYGAKKATCLSPSFCAALYRYPCTSPRDINGVPCGPCIYGRLVTQKGHEVCLRRKKLAPIKKYPQIHKEGPGDDPDFSAVPEQSGPAFLKPQQKPVEKDVNGAFNFLADFARFQQAEQESNQVEARADQAGGFYDRLANLRDQQEEQEDDDGQEQRQQPEENKFVESYLHSLLGRFGERAGSQIKAAEEAEEEAEEGQEMEKTLRSSTTTPKSLDIMKVLSTKAPIMGMLQQQQQQAQAINKAGGIDFAMIALLTCLAVAAAVGVIVSIFCFVKIQRRSRSTQRFDYSGPGNGASGSVKKSGSSGSHDSLGSSAASAAASKLSAIFGGHEKGDKKLANNATLYHFEHHKKEMMAAESTDVPNEFGDSEAESGDENDENDYTVYECPGLAPTGEMQVDNPLFRIKQQASQPGAASSQAARVSPPVVVHGLHQSGSPK